MQLQVTGFFDEATNTISYVASPAGLPAARVPSTSPSPV